MAGVLAATNYPRWRRVQLAMRAGAALPPSRLILVLAAGMALIAVLAAVLVIAG